MTTTFPRDPRAPRVVRLPVAIVQEINEELGVYLRFMGADWFILDDSIRLKDVPRLAALLVELHESLTRVVA